MQWGDDSDDNTDHAIAIAAFGAPLVVAGVVFLLCAPLCTCSCVSCCQKQVGWHQSCMPSSQPQMIDDGMDRAAFGRTMCYRMMMLWLLALVGCVIAFTGLGLMVGAPSLCGVDNVCRKQEWKALQTRHEAWRTSLSGLKATWIRSSMLWRRLRICQPP